jgi:hypothetical protein
MDMRRNRGAEVHNRLRILDEHRTHMESQNQSISMSPEELAEARRIVREFRRQMESQNQSISMSPEELAEARRIVQEFRRQNNMPELSSTQYQSNTLPNG